MDEWGVGWARKDGHITATMAPGHDRPRCVYVDFLNTGPAVSRTLRTVVKRTSGVRLAGDLLIVDLLRQDGEVVGAVRAASAERRRRSPSPRRRRSWRPAG